MDGSIDIHNFKFSHPKDEQNKHVQCITGLCEDRVSHSFHLPSTLLRVIPSLTFYSCILSVIYDILSGNLSGILSDMCSGPRMLHSSRSGQQQEAEKVDEKGGGEEEEGGVAACC